MYALLQNLKNLQNPKNPQNPQNPHNQISAGLAAMLMMRTEISKFLQLLMVIHQSLVAHSAWISSSSPCRTTVGVFVVMLMVPRLNIPLLMIRYAIQVLVKNLVTNGKMQYTVTISIQKSQSQSHNQISLGLAAMLTMPTEILRHLPPVLIHQ